MVGHQHIETIELISGGLNGSFNVVQRDEIAGVRANGIGIYTCVVNDVCLCLGEVSRISGGDRYPCALSGEFRRVGTAKTFAGGEEEHPIVGEFKIHRHLPLRTGPSPFRRTLIIPFSRSAFPTDVSSEAATRVSIAVTSLGTSRMAAS
ncbi:hypothetical protein [Halegenticoccus soli]|uniref:hypothetical protein n=1 Tax=Halegenticoccus soli TaxID=1985678 RepID=UPI001179FB4A|nr:hypothetical protein [Halegenticoccus soli]